MLRNTYIACEWDFDFLDSNYDDSGLNWQVHESVDKTQRELDQPVSLKSCLSLHSKSESLKVQCNYCKKDRMCSRSGRI